MHTNHKIAAPTFSLQKREKNSRNNVENKFGNKSTSKQKFAREKLTVEKEEPARKLV